MRRVQLARTFQQVVRFDGIPVAPPRPTQPRDVERLNREQNVADQFCRFCFGPGPLRALEKTDAFRPKDRMLA